jgi:chemotaxis protein MotB
MSAEDEGGGGVPEWVVTFGDMMSLLLTFFIMLVSMSELKEEERYQAMVDSIRERFGYEASTLSMTPGHLRPRNAPLEHLATLGRARRADTMRGGDKVRAPVGDNPRVHSIRPGQQPMIGGVLYFDEGSQELAGEGLQTVQVIAQILGGKSQKVEIRGHTSRRPPDGDGQQLDKWNLAYQRCRVVMNHLAELGIEPRRFRMAVAADNEPVHLGTDPIEQKKNSRVEVVMLDERVEDLEGTPEQRDAIYVDDPKP